MGTRTPPGVWARVAAVMAVAVLAGCAQAAAATDAVRAAPTACRFVHGFAQLRDVLGELIGECVDDERVDPPTGDSFQRTTRGLLHWRRADGLVAFTDGARTWVRARDGAIHVRPNYERFAWEAPPACGAAPRVRAARRGGPRRRARTDGRRWVARPRRGGDPAARDRSRLDAGGSQAGRSTGS